jgi:hypothetical protein
MRNVLRATSGIIMLSAMAGSPVLAATVTVSSGTVSINSGGGWASVILASPAAPGDKVMAAKNSEGEIVYDDGCFERVKPGKVKTVKAISPCKTGGGTPVGLAGIDPAIIAGLAAAGVVIAVVASNSDDEEAPASP